MIDSPKHKGNRKKLIEKLIFKGITDKKVLNAIYNIPRHFFIEKDFEDFAYNDKAFPISANQTISQPFTVAFQTEKLNILDGEKVLEIGTGSGYQSAILSYLDFDVYTIERDVTLFKKSSLLFKNLSVKIRKKLFGDGYLGIVDSAPFDAIIVTAASKEIPKNLMKQLKVGGRMVIPIGEDEQIMIRFTRFEKNRFKREEFGNFKFVPMIKGK